MSGRKKGGLKGKPSENSPPPLLKIQIPFSLSYLKNRTLENDYFYMCKWPRDFLSCSAAAAKLATSIFMFIGCWTFLRT